MNLQVHHPDPARREDELKRFSISALECFQAAFAGDVDAETAASLVRAANRYGERALGLMAAGERAA